MSKPLIVSYQGEPGANSHIAIDQVYPGSTPLPCRTFDGAMTRVTDGDADIAMIPVENSIAGRVGDIHHLLPLTELSIIGEHYLPIRFQLMALPGVKLSEIKTARTHVVGIGQCRNFLNKHNIEPVVAADTAGAAREVSEMTDRSIAAIAPALAASIYGLDILAKDIEDAAHNTTRFVMMAREPAAIDKGDGPTKTAFVFEVRNIPAALYKVMGGFATNGVNMTKLESYQIGGSFEATQFYAEIEGHPDERRVQLAMQELGFFSQSLKVLGVFAAASYR